MNFYQASRAPRFLQDREGLLRLARSSFPCMNSLSDQRGTASGNSLLWLGFSSEAREAGVSINLGCSEALRAQPQDPNPR